MTAIVPQHCDEAPKRSFLFDNVTALSKRDMKCLATTLTNAFTLLADGYEFDRINPCYYLVTAPADKKGEQAVYNIAFDPALRVASCSCDLNARIGSCKHVLCLQYDKEKIDELHDARVAAVAAAAEAARLEAEAAAEAERLAEAERIAAAVEVEEVVVNEEPVDDWVTKNPSGNWWDRSLAFWDEVDASQKRARMAAAA